MTWDLQISAHCPKLDGEGLTCMACMAEVATGHVRVKGGVADGRVILLIGRNCADPADDAQAIKTALVQHALSSHIDLLTGERGPAGVPEVWHRDHWDPMSDEDHHRSS